MLVEFLNSITDFYFFRNNFCQITTFLTVLTAIILYFFTQDAHLLLDLNLKYNNINDPEHYANKLQKKLYLKSITIKKIIMGGILLTLTILCLTTSSVFRFIKYFEIITICIIIVFLNHQRIGKRKLVFRISIMQILFFTMLTMSYFSITLRNQDLNGLSHLYKMQNKNIFENAEYSFSFYDIITFFSPILGLLATCGFSPFNTIVNNIFKKLSASEKILYIGVIINISQYTIIQIYSRTQFLKYIAIFYLFVNSIKLIFARKVDEIIFNLITLSIAIFLILISINNLSTNYASLFLYAIFIFCFGCIILYEWIYYDTGFVGKPLVISATIKKYNLYNKYAFKSLILIVIALQIISSPISVSFLPFLFLQLTFTNIIFSYCIIFFIFFILGFTLVRLLHPFYTCLKYSTHFSVQSFTTQSTEPKKQLIIQRLQKYFTKVNIILITLCSTLFCIAIYINFSYMFIYKDFYIFDTVIYSLFATFIGFLLYVSKFYIYSLRISKELGKKTTRTYHSIVKYLLLVIVYTNNIIIKIALFILNKIKHYYVRFAQIYNNYANKTNLFF